MILVVGGIASGKQTYARRKGYTQKDMSLVPLSDSPVLVELQERLRTGPLSADEFDAACAKDIVTCCEVGLGVVPVDDEERAWRERVGRTCAELAGHADTVVRMVCGIASVLKEGTGSPYAS